MPARVLRTPNHADIVYCLTAGTCSYVGVTNNMTRRMRQHNGELVGGAKYTTMLCPPGERWRMHYIVTGYARRSHTLQLEWRLHGRVHLPKKQHSPFGGTKSASRRAWQLYWALQMERVTKKAPFTRDLPPLKVYWLCEADARAAQTACPHPWPAQVRHVHARAPIIIKPAQQA